MSETRAILRLIKYRIDGPRKVATEPPKGYLFALRGSHYDVDVYEASLEYLLLQPTGYSDVFPYVGPVRLSERPWSEYCQWHDGPLDEPDDPTRRLYCPVVAEGFCSKHKRTDRAVYSFCLENHSEKALEACKYIDSKIKGEYTVYMVDFGGDRPKVGTTRSFRLYERIAEQPHVVATVLTTTDSLYEARLAEMRLAKEGFAVESWRHRWLGGQDLYFAALRLSEAAERAAKFLGTSWSGRLFAIAHPGSLRPQPVEVEELHKTSRAGYLDLAGAWGGYLILRDQRGRELALRASALLHRDSLTVPSDRLFRRS